VVVSYGCSSGPQKSAEMFTEMYLRFNISHRPEEKQIDHYNAEYMVVRQEYAEVFEHEIKANFTRAEERCIIYEACYEPVSLM
jgi:hypothetical protein